MIFIGLDAGSVSVKLVMLDAAGRRLGTFYERHKGRPLHVAFELLEKAVISQQSAVSSERRTPNAELFSLSVTGSAGKIISSVLDAGFTNELTAQAYSTRKLYPHINTIFELGGEDSKLIMLEQGVISDFSMNSVCAAGTGSFLDQQAERLMLTIEEFSELALKSERPSRVAGRCSVFAKSDMIHLQQIATPIEDIVAGLCFAVARNFKGSIVRGRTILGPVAFHGGVAANKGMVRAFREVFGLSGLFVPEEYALMGAAGAVLKDLDEGIVSRFDISRLKAFIESDRLSEAGHKPLISNEDDFSERHLKNNSELQAASCKLNGKENNSLLVTRHSSLINAYLGIDIGSISTNLAVIDDRGRLLAKRYLMTAGRPIEAVRQGLQEIGEEIGGYTNIMGVGTTGSGRYMIADFVGADIVKNEITAQATAAAFIDKDVDTIFEIGGQDSKYISMKNGVIVDFEMNKACAAGTGSFLEEQAEKLNTSIKGEFAECACSAENPCRLGERCTVFMENSLMSNLQRGAGRDDLLAGLAYSIVQNYINKVVAGKPIGRNIFFQGGVAFNKSVVAAFEKYLNRKIKVPPDHDVTGAIGMALIAMKHMKGIDTETQSHGDPGTQKIPHRVAVSPSPRVSASSSHRTTSFKGFEITNRPYQVSSFECRACSNVCEINRIKIEGEDGYLFYGGRCEKYDVKSRKNTSEVPDLFKFREEMLWKEHYVWKTRRNGETEKQRNESPSRRVAESPSLTKIGIPYIFFMHDYLPYWTTLLWELGFYVEVSPKTDRRIIDTGSESVLADTCFPVKVAHGHIKHLVDNGIRHLFMPSFVNVNRAGGEYKTGSTCPLTQTIPYAARVAHPDVNVIAPVIDFKRGDAYFVNELLKPLSRLGVSKGPLIKALSSAQKAQDDFTKTVSDKGHEALSQINKNTVVVVGRPYNAFDSGMNLNLPRKLAEIGVLSLPFDLLPSDRISISEKWPNMYWRSGQRILKAARFIRNNPYLYAVYIGNFSCGPDSFILKFFEEEMKGKPFLHLEIDEHSADAGAITRCEAFLDSIENQRNRDAEKRRNGETEKDFTASPRHPVNMSLAKRRTIYIPRMSDHAFALAAAFERCGVPSEVLPESDKEAIDIGRRFVSGKECYPCTVTTGDMVKKALSPEFRPEESVFFMPSGSGPCRFGQYNVFHKLVLEELGHRDVPVLSPNQDVEFYKELGIVGKDFSRFAWEGIVAYELLSKCLHETRPYETEKGSADRVYKEYIEKLYFTLRGVNGKTSGLLKQARRDFEGLPRLNIKKPLIGIVGEIFVRSNRFSNEDVIRKVEALGGEAWLAPVEEWIYYVNRMSLRKALIKKQGSAIIQILLKEFFQKRIEHGYTGLFEGFLRTINEPDVEEVLKKASPYLHDSFEGEAILSIGKSLDLIEKGASGIINTMPFGCMPGTVVTTLMRGVVRDYGIPFISISYDGSESPVTGIQLEAFMNQAKEHSRIKNQ